MSQHSWRRKSPSRVQATPTKLFGLKFVAVFTKLFHHAYHVALGDGSVHLEGVACVAQSLHAYLCSVHSAEDSQGKAAASLKELKSLNEKSRPLDIHQQRTVKVCLRQAIRHKP